jgi:hypothetical protein
MQKQRLNSCVPSSFSTFIFVLVIGMFIARLFFSSLTSNGELAKLRPLRSPTLNWQSQVAMGSIKTAPNIVDVLTVTAADLKGLLDNGAVSSVELVDLYLAQIEKHNRQGAKLHAMISTVPRDLLLQTAEELDKERSAGQVRGALHGIPIVVKVSKQEIIAFDAEALRSG